MQVNDQDRYPDPAYSPAGPADPADPADTGAPPHHPSAGVDWGYDLPPTTADAGMQWTSAALPPMTEITGLPKRRKLGRPIALTVAGLVVVGGIVAGGVFAAGAGQVTPHAVPAPPASPASAAWCHAGTVDGVVTVNGRGGTASGPDAVALFEHGYYDLRSGTAAHRAVAPGAAVPDPATIQTGIDTIPKGTQWCAEVRPDGADSYAVTIRERRPEGAERTWPQTVTTTVVDGKTLITAIRAR